MVDVTFNRRLPLLVPLALLRSLAALASPPSSLSYLTNRHLAGIKEMDLLNRGRLSVQPVEDVAWEAIELLGVKGGWEDILDAKGSKKRAATSKKGSGSKDADTESESKERTKRTGGQKRKRDTEVKEALGQGVRRSTRVKQAK